MDLDRVVDGTTFSGEPNWQPLLNLAPEEIDDFMWMFAIETDGGRIEAYKHCETRNYLHLDGQGAAFVFTDDERYKQVGAAWLLDIVLRRRFF